MVEKAKDGPLKEHLAAIREHVQRPRANHEVVRKTSREQYQSIVTAIFESTNPDLNQSLSETQHRQCMEYYSTLLSIRDREEIINVLCRQNPDLFTQTVKEAMAALDPLIRQVHDKIDLKEHLTDAEGFIGEFIKVGKGTKIGDGWGLNSGGFKRTPSSTKDYVDLLRDHRYLLYKWLHRIASQTPEIRDTFRQWAVETVKVFRNPALEAGNNDLPGGEGSASDKSSHQRCSLATGAGAMDAPLTKIFASLPEETQKSLLPVLDSHARYLSSLHETSTARMQAILDEVNEPVEERRPVKEDVSGPGLYLASWQNLMDETLITPEKPHGAVRYGRDVRNAVTQGKTGAASSGRNSRSGSPAPSVREGSRIQRSLDGPDTKLVVAAMDVPFGDFLADLNEKEA